MHGGPFLTPAEVAPHASVASSVSSSSSYAANVRIEKALTFTAAGDSYVTPPSVPAPGKLVYGHSFTIAACDANQPYVHDPYRWPTTTTDTTAESSLALFPPLLPCTPSQRYQHPYNAVKQEAPTERSPRSDGSGGSAHTPNSQDLSRFASSVSMRSDRFPSTRSNTSPSFGPRVATPVAPVAPAESPEASAAPLEVSSSAESPVASVAPLEFSSSVPETPTAVSGSPAPAASPISAGIPMGLSANGYPKTKHFLKKGSVNDRTGTWIRGNAVTNVMEGAIAELAGLKVGMRILELDGKKADPADVSARLRKAWKDAGRVELVVETQPVGPRSKRSLVKARARLRQKALSADVASIADTLEPPSES
ncbi:hypothetical protein DIPPA_17674 [Diplonema papillatum]|nr:hypothetical protein DIPPA_17674 [Diplonema papillatum]